MNSPKTRRGSHRAHRRIPRHVSDRAQAALGLGLLLSVGTLGTQAAWTDAVSVVGATFSTGSIDLKVNGVDSDADVTTLGLTGMVPGNTTAGVLTIRNDGTVPLTYTAVASATDADGEHLAAALVVKVTADLATAGTAPTRTCPGVALAGTGTSLDAGLVTTGRLLAAGASEKLCVQVTLPATAPSSLQGATTTATLTFTGTSDLS